MSYSYLEYALNGIISLSLVDAHDGLLGGVRPEYSVLEESESDCGWHLRTSENHHSVVASVIRRFDIVQQRVTPVDSFGNDVSGYAGDFISRFGDDGERVSTVHVGA